MRGKRLLLFLAAAWSCVAATPSRAAQTTVCVSEVKVSGAENPGALKDVLANLLASRLSGDGILVLDNCAGAAVQVTGNYAEIGKHFSLDVTSRDQGGKVLGRSFEQGESRDDLIPAVGKVARKAAAGIEQAYAPKDAPPAPEKLPAPAPPKKMEAAPADIIKAAPTAPPAALIPRIEGELTGLAPARELADGGREVFVTSLNSFALYRVGKGDKLLFKRDYPATSRIIAVDSADLDGDGAPEAYLTIVSGEALASEVWKVQGETLQLVQGNLPYFFRGIALAGGAKKIYAQQMGVNDDFYGKIAELFRDDKGYQTRNPLKLPASASLYSFNVFKDSAGADHEIVLDQGGRLTVFAGSGEDLWRSNVKYGGTVTYFEREDLANARVTDSKTRRVYLQQRISVTAAGEILVPQNEGSFGKSYDRNTLFALAWNGAALEEKWHTKVEDGALSDYFYDSAKKELVLLEVVKKAGPFSKGASAIVVKRTE